MNSHRQTVCSQWCTMSGDFRLPIFGLFQFSFRNSLLKKSAFSDSCWFLSLCSSDLNYFLRFSWLLSHHFAFAVLSQLHLIYLWQALPFIFSNEIWFFFLMCGIQACILVKFLIAVCFGWLVRSFLEIKLALLSTIYVLN